MAAAVSSVVDVKAVRDPTAFDGNTEHLLRNWPFLDDVDRICDEGCKDDKGNKGKDKGPQGHPQQPRALTFANRVIPRAAGRRQLAVQRGHLYFTCCLVLGFGR